MTLEPDWQTADGSVRLYRGDCLEVMPELTETVDAVICDLPYGTTACKWDTVIPFAPLWEAYRRLVRADGAIALFGSEPFSSHLRLSNIGGYKYDWTWNKASPTGFLNAKKQPLRVTENISVFYQFTPTYNPKMEMRGKPRRKGGHNKPGGSDIYGKFNNAPSFNNLYCPTNIISISNANRVGQLHPTQKPVTLLEYLIETYTNEGETVLDNTFGSGTTAVACINTSRRFIGIERDEHYFDVAVNRCKEALGTVGLFASTVAS